MVLQAVSYTLGLQFCDAIEVGKGELKRISSPGERLKYCTVLGVKISTYELGVGGFSP